MRAGLGTLILLVISTLLVLFKFQDLSLPYFWDEAWSYIPAVHAMIENGPSMMPGAIDAELYRGHPLLFYFLQASWMSLFGQSIFVAKCLSLLLSIALLLAIYRLARRHFGQETAILALVFFAIQAVFLAQAAFVLPEILLALLSVLSVDAFLRGRKLQTALWLALALFTKETAVVLFIALVLAELYRNRSKDALTSSTYLLIPLILIAGFYVLQKLVTGWYFFPEHIAFIDMGEFLAKLESFAASLFINMGRSLLTFTAAACLAYLLKSKALTTKKRDVLLLFALFVLGYMVFSALNFYSPRYLLSTLPFTVMAFSFLLVEVFKKRKVLGGSIVLVLLLFNGYHTATQRGYNDDTLGFRDGIACDMEVVRYCEENGLREKPMGTTFLLKHYLSNASAGYLNGGAEFSMVSDRPLSVAQFFLIPAAERGEDWQEIRAKASLIKVFERGEARVELYQLGAGRK